MSLSHILQLVVSLDDFNRLVHKFRKTAGFIHWKFHDWLSVSNICADKLFFFKGRAWHFLLLNFVRFLLANFSSLSRSLEMTTHPSGVSILHFLMPVYLMKLHFVLSLRSLLTILYSAGHSIGLWDISLVTSSQLDLLLITTL